MRSPQIPLFVSVGADNFLIERIEIDETRIVLFNNNCGNNYYCILMYCMNDNPMVKLNMYKTRSNIKKYVRKLIVFRSQSFGCT